jgi:AsmA protein
MKKVGIVLLALIVLLIVAIIAVPRFIDWNGYKPEIAAAVKDATGRDLVINGDIKVSILPDISFELSDVRLSNAAGAENADMFTLADVRGKLALFPLISRNVVVEELVITKPALYLDVDADGRPNWAFSGMAAQTEQPAEPAASSEGLPVSDIKLGDVRVVDGLIVYSDARTGQKVTAESLQVQAALDGLADAFNLDVGMTLNGEPVKLTTVLDSPGALLAGDRASLIVALDNPRVSVAYDGGLQQKPVPALDGTFDLSIPSVGELAAWLDRPLADNQPDPGPLDVHAVFEGKGKRMVLKQATIEGKALHASANGQVDMSGEVNRIALNVEAGVLDIDRYLPPPAEKPMQVEAPKDTGEKGGGQPFDALSDEPFDLTPLKQTNADIKIIIGGIKAMGYEVGQIGFNAKLADGVLDAKLAELQLYGGNVTGDLHVDGLSDSLGIDTQFDINNVNVGALARAAQGDQAKVAGVASGSLKASGNGASPRALAESLVASAKLSLGGIDVQNAPGVISKVDLAVDLPGVSANPSIDGTVVYNKEAVTFSLASDPLQTVLTGDRFNTNVSVKSKRISLGYKGAVQRAPVPGMDGEFSLDVPSVGSLLGWLGQPLPQGQPDPGPLKVDAVLAAEGTSAAIREATIKGKGLDAKASGNFDGSGEIAKFALNVEAGVLDIDSYLPAPAAPAAQPPAARPAGNPLAALPDEPFDLTPLKKAEGTVSLSLGGVKVVGYELGRTALDADLKGGVLNVNLKELRLYGGNIAGTLMADGSGDALGIDTKLTMSDVDVGALAKSVQGEAAQVSGIASGTIGAKGRGGSPRKLAESLAANADIRLGGVDVAAAGPGLTEAAVKLDMPGFDKPTNFQADVVYNREKVSATVAVAPPQQVMSGKPFDLDLKVASKVLTASYKGSVQTDPVPGLNGSVDVNIPSMAGLASWLDMPLDPDQPDPGKLKLSAVMKADGRRTAIEKASIEGKALMATAAASVDTSTDIMRFDANVDILEADLNAYLPPSKGGEEAKVEPAVEAPGPSGWSEEPIDFSALHAMNGKAALKIGSIKYNQVEIANGTGTVTVGGGVLKAVVDGVQVAGGSIGMNATVDASKPAAAIDYKLSITDVQARPLLISFAGSDRLSGTMEFETAGRAQGANQKQLVGALNGDGHFIFKDGAIHGINIAAALRNVGSMGLGQSEDQKTDFAELSGSYTITNGVLENKDLKMLAPLVRLSGAGQVAMPPRTVDYNVQATLVASLQGQGGEEGLTGLPIPVAITGTWANPSYDIDWKSVLTAAAQDPARLANMPDELRQMGENMGIDLPIPGLGTEGGTGAAGAAGALLQGVTGGTESTTEGGAASGLGGILQGVTGGAQAPSETGGTTGGAETGAPSVGGLLQGLTGGGQAPAEGTAPATGGVGGLLQGLTGGEQAPPPATPAPTTTAPGATTETAALPPAEGGEGLSQPLPPPSMTTPPPPMAEPVAAVQPEAAPPPPAQPAAPTPEATTQPEATAPTTGGAGGVLQQLLPPSTSPTTTTPPTTTESGASSTETQQQPQAPDVGKVLKGLFGN